jgi:hypothetical protein
MPVFLGPIATRINGGGQLPPQAFPYGRFQVFPLGRATAITDNGTLKAALSGEMIVRRKGG